MILKELIKLRQFQGTSIKVYLILTALQMITPLVWLIKLNCGIKTNNPKGRIACFMVHNPKMFMNGV